MVRGELYFTKLRRFPYSGVGAKLEGFECILKCYSYGVFSNKSLHK